MEWQQVVQYIFYGIISFVGLSLVTLMTFLVSSVQVLNVRIAEILKEIGYHESRITKLEGKQR